MGPVELPGQQAPGLDAQGAGAGLPAWLPPGTPPSAVYKTPTEKRVRTRKRTISLQTKTLVGKFELH